MFVRVAVVVILTFFWFSDAEKLTELCPHKDVQFSLESHKIGLIIIEYRAASRILAVDGRNTLSVASNNEQRSW